MECIGLMRWLLVHRMYWNNEVVIGMWNVLE